MESKDLELLARDKYDGDASQVTDEDRARLAADEPLAYVIGWVPFLGLRIGLGTKPLIPRPETEWWTEELIAHLRRRFGDSPFTLLDLCAGSGCIGLAVLHALPNATVTFAELVSEHARQIQENMRMNGIDATRATICSGDLFDPLPEGATFSIIVSNPPYIPEGRELPLSVRGFEPNEALVSGPDGLSLIRRIAANIQTYLEPQGELWLECDMDNVKEAAALCAKEGLRTEVRTDQYGRPRLVLAYS